MFQYSGGGYFADNTAQRIAYGNQMRLILAVTSLERTRKQYIRIDDGLNLHSSR